jgi:hypothetical protein
MQRPARGLAWTVLAILGVAAGACRSRPADVAPSIQLTRIPEAAEGGPDRMVSIAGRVSGARPGQQIVLFARAGPWWVQPLADQPFTAIRRDSTWESTTHLGTEYAALLVEPAIGRRRGPTSCRHRQASWPLRARRARRPRAPCREDAPVAGYSGVRDTPGDAGAGRTAASGQRLDGRRGGAASPADRQATGNGPAPVV